MHPKDRMYLETHEWAKQDGDLVIVGITTFAVEQLGELVYLDLPETGRQIDKSEVFGEVESVKAVSDLVAPVAGEVVEVNGPLSDDLTPLQDDPHESGWLMKVKPKDMQTALDGLMNLQDYEQLVASEH